jgi:hypothetical protein
MTKVEFQHGMAWLTAAIGKPIADGTGPMADAERRARLDAYFECLHDLPAEVLKLAAKRVVMTHKWNTFPSVAEIRQAAADVVQGQVGELPAGKAWELAWGAACKIDVEVEGSVQRRTAELPPLVLDTLKAFGIPALCKALAAFARPEFLKLYDGLLAYRRQRALLPTSLVKQIESYTGEQTKALPSAVKSIVGEIGTTDLGDAK